MLTLVREGQGMLLVPEPCRSLAANRREVHTILPWMIGLLCFWSQQITGLARMAMMGL